MKKYQAIYKELPWDYSPGVVAFLLRNKKIASNAVFATLLDLVRKKYISVEMVVTSSLYSAKRMGEAKYTLRKQNIDELMAHEKFLINWFFKVIGDGYSFKCSDINIYWRERNNVKKFVEGYNNFKVNIERESNKFFFFKKLNTLDQILALLGSPKRTSIGQEHFGEWMDFKKFLLDSCSMSTYDIKTFVIWEHYFIYAIILEIAKEVLGKLPTIYGENLTLLGYQYMHIIPFTGIERAMTQMDSYFANAARYTEWGRPSDDFTGHPPLDPG